MLTGTLNVSPAWQAAYPSACVGALIMRQLANPEHHERLDRLKTDLEAQLRARFAGQDRGALADLPTIQAYTAYYGRYRKTYHVLLQLESVALKGRSIPRVASLVEAMFMAELKNQLLTAGHDFEALDGQVRLDVARGDESYTLLNGKDQIPTAGDMCISDAQGIISTVLHGPDQRTRILPRTEAAFFAVYAPAGIEPALVRKHLENIRDYVVEVAPAAVVDSLQVVSAG